MAREVTISACQYLVQPIRGFEDMAGRVRALLDKAAGSDIAIFPELFTIELFTTLKDWQKRPISELVLIDDFTDAYMDLFKSEARKRGQFIVGGSHLQKAGDRYENIGHLFGPDGEHFQHTKTHIFPAEANWSTSEGDKMETFQLPLAKVGFNICYETEIPECSASLTGLHRLNPSVIVLASYFVDDAIGFQRAFAADPLPALVYGIYGPSVPAFRSALGPLSEGVVWATTTGVYADAIGENFRRRHQKRFRQMPGHSQAGLAYDRINLLAGAWSRTGRPRRFADVITDLRSSISRGVNGAYFLGNEGQVGLTFPDDTTDPSISQAHLVFQVQDGENVILAPTPYSHAGFRVPRWFRTGG